VINGLLFGAARCACWFAYDHAGRAVFHNGGSVGDSFFAERRITRAIILDMDDASAVPPSLRLNGATRADRLTITAKIRDIIVTECHGWIGDFYQYSNTSLCLHFEIPAERVPALHNALSEAAIGFGPDADEAYQCISSADRKSDFVPCILQITFIHDEPDLRRKIPAVPG
jgi:hypothetical protein